MGKDGLIFIVNAVSSFFRNEVLYLRSARYSY